MRTTLTYLLKYGLPLIITTGLCYLLLHDIDLSQMLTTIRTQCNFRWIAAMIVVSILSHIARAARWQIQLRALGINATLWQLTLSIFGTYAVNLIFPRLGEIWRTGYIAQRTQSPFDKTFGSMIADRLADTLTVALLTLATFLLARTQLTAYLSQNPDTYRRITTLATSPWLWSAITAIAATTAAIFIRYPSNPLIAKTRTFIKGLWQGIAVIATMPRKNLWLLLTLSVWGCYYLQLYLAFLAFPLTAQLTAQYGPIAILVCFVLSSISMGVPSNGGIGPWQWAIIFGISLYPVAGLHTLYATTFANLVMGTQTLLLIALGLITFITIAVQKRTAK